MSLQSEPESVIIDLFAKADDAPDVVALMHRAFAEYALMSGAMLETDQTLRAEMNDGLRVAVLRRNARIVASAKHTPLADGSLYFSRLAVAPESRGFGLASGVVRALRTQAHAEGLAGLSCAVRADEAQNIAIYTHLGMEVTAHETRVSRTGATLDVVVMRDAKQRQE